MAVIPASLHLEITDAVRERIALADSRERVEWTVAEMADATCRAFCGPRGMTKGLNGVQLDIHRRQHVEIAQAIFDQKGA